MEYFVFDIAPTQLVMRLLSQRSKIPLVHFVGEGGMEDADWPKLSSSISITKDSNINFIEHPETTLEKQLEKISASCKKENRLIIVQGLDYLEDTAIYSGEAIFKFLNKIKALCKANKKTIVISMNRSLSCFYNKDSESISKRLISAADLCIDIRESPRKGRSENVEQEIVLDILRNCYAPEESLLASYLERYCVIEAYDKGYYLLSDEKGVD